jgi:hypothetical protein
MSSPRKNNGKHNIAQGGPAITKGYPNFQTEEFQLGYIYRGIEEQLNNFGTAPGGKITVSRAAHWVATLLLAKTSGGLLYGTEHLPRLRGETPEGHEIGPSSSSLHVGAHAGQSSVKHPMSRATKAKLSVIAKARWAKKSKGRVKSGTVVCRICGKPSPNRSEYMLHCNQAHPEEMAKRVKAMKKAKEELQRAA